MPQLKNLSQVIPDTVVYPGFQVILWTEKKTRSWKEEERLVFHKLLILVSAFGLYGKYSEQDNSKTLLEAFFMFLDKRIGFLD